MKESITGNNKYLKEMNQSTLLDLIRTNEGMSRKGLADKTGLSATATGAIVKSLLSDGYIRETGAGQSSGGRKPVMLEINPDSYYAFGFDIDAYFIYAVVMDITGQVVDRRRLESSDLTPGKAVDSITGAFYELLARRNIAQERVLGVGISVPGMLDRATGSVVFAPNLGWINVPIIGMLQEKLSVNVHADNEAMCSASCENWLGSCKGVDDFICINIESGIGAGIFLRGMMYRGISGSAGEVGHIVVDEKGPKCNCGNRGCLETKASIKAMAAQYEKISAEKSFDGEKPMDYWFECLLNGARSGDTDCLAIMKTSAISLGKAIAYLINTFNPGKIVLGKKFPQYGDLIMEQVQSTALDMALAYPSRNVEIAASSFGEDSSALGAAIIPIRKLFGR